MSTVANALSPSAGQVRSWICVPSRDWKKLMIACISRVSTMKLYEIYTSIQGETQYAGLPCTLVRFAACDLRCGYCDTEYAFTGGQEVAVDAIVRDVEARGARLVLLTGGEPMLQRELPELAAELLARGFEVMIETGGHRDVSTLPEAVVKIVDVKTPGSGESHKMLWGNLER